jgi:hypothetical protein
MALASIVRDGPPTESVDRFRTVGWGWAGWRPGCRLGGMPVPRSGWRVLS